MPKQHPILSKYSYVDPTSQDFDSSKNQQLIEFMRTTLEKGLKFSDMGYVDFIQLLNKLHLLICDGMDKGNEERKATSIVFNHEYALLIAMNYAKAISASSIVNKLQKQGKPDAKSMYLRASGLEAKAVISEKLEETFSNILYVVNNCLTKYSEETVKDAIDNDKLFKLAETCPPPEFQETAIRLSATLKKLGFDFDKMKDPNEKRAFIEKHQAEFAKLMSHEPAGVLDDKTIQANHLTVYAMASKKYETFRQVHMPVIRIFVQPKLIQPRLKIMFDTLQHSLRQNLDLFEIATQLHCDYIDIHPKSGSTKRVARALMNLLLMSKGCQPVTFDSPQEIDIYQETSLQRIFYNYAPESEKAQYDKNSFKLFIKNKLEMTPEQLQNWMNDSHKAHYLERTFRTAYRQFPDPTIFFEKLKQVNPRDLPEEISSSFRIQASYAVMRLDKMPARTVSSENNRSSQPAAPMPPSSTKAIKPESNESSAATTQDNKGYLGMKSGFFNVQKKEKPPIASATSSTNVVIKKEADSTNTASTSSSATK